MPTLRQHLVTTITTYLMLASTASASEFRYRAVEHFLPLRDFYSIEAFEARFNDYVQYCLDNTSGGSASVECFVGYEMWDRELNFYYRRLMDSLDIQGREALKNSQRTWLKMRDASIEFNSALMDNTYTEEGTLYQAMRAGKVDELITPMIKSRALTLKAWSETVEPAAPNHPSEFIKKNVGFWGAYSKNIYSIYGDLRFDDARLDLALKGSFRYEIVEDRGTHLFLKLDRELDCNTQYIRVGPIKATSRGTFMEFALLPPERLNDALEAVIDPSASSNSKHACSWGVYVKERL